MAAGHAANNHRRPYLATHQPALVDEWPGPATMAICGRMQPDELAIGQPGLVATVRSGCWPAGL